jgi:hypothetical protein
MKRGSTWEKVLLLLASPLIALFIVLIILLAPFYWAYRFLLRCLVEILWGWGGKRVLLVYSRSPHWHEYIESQWLPRLARHAVVLNWSDRAMWKAESPFAHRVFRALAPERDFNPMALLFRPWRPTQRVGFYYAFRDLRHGNCRTLQEAEERLFNFVERLEQGSV